MGKLRIAGLVLVLFSILPFGTFAQTPDTEYQQAKTLMDKQRYQESLVILNKLLKADPNNRDYQTAQKNAQKGLDVQTAADLTAQALELVSKEKYADASALLKKAIALDPSNKEAADMYISLTDLVKAESESEARAKAEAEAKRKAEEAARIAEEKRKAEEAEKARLAELQKKAEADAEIQKKVIEARKSFSLSLLLDADLSSASESATMLDTTALWLGPQMQFSYFLPILDKRLGFEAGYQGGFAKIFGDPWIDLLIHSAWAATSFRVFFLEDLENTSYLKVSLGYFLFDAVNQKPANKVYAVNLVGAPFLGLSLSDPTISHFVPGAPWRYINFKAGVKGSIVPRDSGNLIYLDISAGIGYKIGEFEILGLWNGQSFIQTGTDSYNHFAIGASMEF